LLQSGVCRFPNDGPAAGFVTGHTRKSRLVENRGYIQRFERGAIEPPPTTCNNPVLTRRGDSRAPRLGLLPHEKADVEAMMAKELKNKPLLPNVGLKAA
jgi:hypothetical protein